MVQGLPPRLNAHKLFAVMAVSSIRSPLCLALLLRSLLPFMSLVPFLGFFSDSSSFTFQVALRRLGA